MKLAVEAAAGGESFIFYFFIFFLFFISFYTEIYYSFDFVRCCLWNVYVV